MKVWRITTKPTWDTGFTRLLHKAQGKSPEYLAWKVMDKFRKYIHKYTRQMDAKRFSEEKIQVHLKPIIGKGQHNLQNYLLSRPNFRFFVSQEEIPTVLAHLNEFIPAYRQTKIKIATQICQNKLPVLSVGVMDLGKKIDWHRDYRSGLRWENKYAFEYDVMDLARPSDVRTVWELNRLHFLVELGIAYRLTKNEQYTKHYIDIVTNWDEENPYAYSINWGCAMEPAIRVVNLIWALELFLTSPNLNDDFLLKVLRILLQHGQFIRQNLEYADVRGNHYIADMVGLVFLGVYLPEFPTAKKWLKFGIEKLEEEIVSQGYEDGSWHEGAIPYHRLVTEFFLYSAILLERNQIRFSNGYYERLERMLEFIQSYLQPDGTVPLFGDTDDGKLLKFNRHSINDHRYLLLIGATVFDRVDFKHTAGKGHWEESTWILGLAEERNSERGPQPISRKAVQSFWGAGYHFLRANDCYIAVDCGDVGGRGRGGHGHNDGLSFVMSLGQEQIIVDYGCPRYTDTQSGRLQAISITNHNLTTVDDAELAELQRFDIAVPGPFYCEVIALDDNEEAVRFLGERRGEVNVDKMISIQREISLYKKQNKLSIKDTISGRGVHTLRSRILLASGVRVQIKDGGDSVIAQTIKGKQLKISTEGHGEWLIEKTIYYPSYGKAVPTQRVTLESNVKLPNQVAILIEWQPSNDKGKD